MSLFQNNKSARVLGAVALLIAGILAYSYILLNSPNVPLLIDAGEASWIRYPRPYSPGVYYAETYTMSFRKTFQVSGPVAGTRMIFTAFRDCWVTLDGRIIFSTPETADSWKTEYYIDIPASSLAAGTHELCFRVRNQSAHPLLRVKIPALNIASGVDWDSSVNEINWKPAERAHDVKILDISREFSSPIDSLMRILPFIAPLFLVTFLLSAFRERLTSLSRMPGIFFTYVTSENLRYLLLAYWVALAAHNIFKLPAYTGFDYPQHIDYIRWIAEKKALPLASDGWQMFQPPLYYALSALLYSFLQLFFSADVSLLLLRIIPFSCGMIQVQLSYLALQRLFRDQPGARMAGLFVAGLLPMNLYINQYVGNEPLAAVLTGGAIYCLIYLSTEPESAPYVAVRGIVVLAGVFLGLAILTKMTAILFIPLFCGYLVRELRRRAFDWFRSMRLTGGFVGIVCLVCSWFYLRNWWIVGTPFIYGWENAHKSWWQDPGFRTLGQIFRFGDVFSYPVAAATVSFWDGFYSTFWADGYLSSTADVSSLWNYDFMLAGIILGVVPAVLLLAGFLAALSGYGSAQRPVFFFSALMVFCMMFALFHLFMTVPIYSTVKATYTSGMTILYALFAAIGYTLLRSCSRWCVSMLVAVLICWGAVAARAYFIW